jgi:hypothetical protein
MLVFHFLTFKQEIWNHKSKLIAELQKVWYMCTMTDFWSPYKRRFFGTTDYFHAEEKDLK